MAYLSILYRIGMTNQVRVQVILVQERVTIDVKGKK